LGELEEKKKKEQSKNEFVSGPTKKGPRKAPQGGTVSKTILEWGQGGKLGVYGRKRSLADNDVNPTTTAGTKVGKTVKGAEYTFSP